MIDMLLIGQKAQNVMGIMEKVLGVGREKIWDGKLSKAFLVL